MDEQFMMEAILEAKKSLITDDVPVGAVIVYNNNIIARGHNCKEAMQNAVCHAEIIAIKNACKYFKNWHLDDCTMYVTLEPCLMCAGALIQSRISRLVYATASDKFGYVESIDQVLSRSENNHIVEVSSGICKLKSQELLKNFFDKKRK